MRPLLLSDLSNNRLRKRYLDARSSAFWAADVRHAHRRLILMSGLTVVAGFALLGISGGLSAVALLDQNSKGSTLAAFGTGGMLWGALTFAILGALGHVVLADLVGERSGEASRSPSRAAAMAKIVVEAVGGMLWGAFWGLLIGLTGGLLALLVMPSALLAAGALGGMTVGLAAGLFRSVLAYSRGPGDSAGEWAWLGPLPIWAYALPFTWARRRYLR